MFSKHKQLTQSLGFLLRFLSFKLLIFKVMFYPVNSDSKLWLTQFRVLMMIGKPALGLSPNGLSYFKSMLSVTLHWCFMF